ncbi:MAG TPA: hypothetical protein VG013_15260 [Gemmataceae bacterium]|nr:hypothetical protein [Gemmataceae bacterium]
MSNGFPCPNPSCSHVFPRASVAASGSLTCPRCGMVFQFRADAETAKASPAVRPAPPPDKPAVPPAAARPAPPAPQPVPIAAAVTAARPPQPAIPVAAPVGPAPGAADNPFATPLQLSPTARPPLRRRARGWGKYAVLGVVLAGIAGLVVVAVKLFSEQDQDQADALPGQKAKFPLHNCQFVVPPDPWAQDHSLQTSTGANLLTMRRSDPNGWLALAGKDYKTRTPRDAEVIDEGVRRLEGYFQNFQWEQKGDVDVGGQKAQRLVFQGEVKEVRMGGECYVLTAQGIAYWLSVWTPAKYADQEAKEFDQMRARFTVLGERNGWEEKRPTPKTFRGTKVPYTLRDTQGVWEQDPEPQNADADADLLLRGKDPADPQDVLRMAQVMVLILGPQNNAAAAVAGARTRLEKQEKKDTPGITVEPLSDKDDADAKAVRVGTTRGHILTLHVKGQSRHRFVLLAVVRRPDQVLVVQCDCDLKRRSLWERDFRQLLDTFALK